MLSVRVAVYRVFTKVVVRIIVRVPARAAVFVLI